jgi:hypothetical protein
MNPRQMVPGHSSIPATFWEWFCEMYPPNDFVYNWQSYFVAITAAANTASNTNNLNIQMPLFAFVFRSKAVISSTGVPPGYVYGIGIAMSSGNDWTQGQWIANCITGDNQAYQNSELRYEWPREVPASTQLTVTVNNAIYASSAQLTVHAGLAGLEPRRREQSIGRLR